MKINRTQSHLGLIGVEFWIRPKSKPCPLNLCMCEPPLCRANLGC